MILRTISTLLIIFGLSCAAYSFTYKNNPKTGKQDLVTTSVTDLTDITGAYTPLSVFRNYTSLKSGSNIVYYCNAGISSGNLCRGNGCSCVGGSWATTNLTID